LRHVDRHLGSAGGKGRDTTYECTRLGHSEVCPECVFIDPMFEKHEPQWVLGIVVDGVQETPWLPSGAAHMREAEGHHLVDTFRPDLDAAGHYEHKAHHSDRHVRETDARSDETSQAFPEAVALTRLRTHR
jgi:hypothetical protein